MWSIERNRTRFASAHRGWRHNSRSTTFSRRGPPIPDDGLFAVNIADQRRTHRAAPWDRNCRRCTHAGYESACDRPEPANRDNRAGGGRYNRRGAQAHISDFVFEGCRTWRPKAFAGQDQNSGLTVRLPAAA